MAEETLRFVIQQELVKVEQTLQSPSADKMDVFLCTEGLYSRLLYIHESSLANGVITEEVLDIVCCLLKVIECMADDRGPEMNPVIVGMGIHNQ